MIHQPTHPGPSITTMVFAAMLEDVDPRLSKALGYREPVYITREVWDQLIDRADDAGQVDQSARMVQLLWHAKVALDGHPWPQSIPFTITTPTNEHINIAARRDTGDCWESIIVLTEAESHPITVAGRVELPAVELLNAGGYLIPRVTVAVLHTAIAVLIDAGIVDTYGVGDSPENPVTIRFHSGDTLTLTSRVDGTYMLGQLADPVAT